LSYIDAPEFIQNFEDANLDKLMTLNISHYNLWQIVKVPLFYELLKGNTIKINSTKTDYSNRYFKYFIVSVKILKYSLKFFWYSCYVLLQKPGKYIFFLNAVDRKISKQGLLINPIFNPILELSNPKNNLIFEEFNVKGSKYKHSPDVDLNFTNFIISRFIRIRELMNSDVTQFIDLFNQQCESSQTKNTIDSSFIFNTVNHFFKEKLFWVFILNRLKPKKVFSSEKICTGLLAAAIELNIPFYEFQHGNIDFYYPPYVISKEFKNVSNDLRPTKIVVFGDLAKNIVTRSGYYSNEEIFILGRQSINEARKMISSDVEDHLLFIFQPMMPRLNERIVEKINNLSSKFHIKIKFHPLQSKEEISRLLNFLNKTKIEVLDTNSDIYDAISNSKIVISHVSTVLDESLSLGRMSVTITTEEFPLGIHSMTKCNDLVDVILPVKLNDLETTLSNLLNSDNAQKELLQAIEKKKYFIYADNVNFNVKQLVL